MKLKQLASFGLLALLVTLTIILFAIRINDAHAISESAKLNELAAAHDAIRRMEAGMLRDGEYPEFYAGAYVDEDSNVIVCLTCDVSVVRSLLEKYLDDVPEKYVMVENSLNKLRKNKKIIEDSLGDSLAFISIEIELNKVIVYLKEFDPNIIDRIYGSIDSDIVDFKEKN